MDDALDLDIAGERLRLLADRALYWPARRRLYIADLHLGKADTFRSHGIALPSGGSAHDLRRLGELIEATQAQSLCILGDVVHGRAVESSWRAAWTAFRERHWLPIRVVDGNHDRALAGLALDLELLGDAVTEEPFLLHHAPPRAPAAQHVLCGHVHPVLKLPGEPRVPAFWLRSDCTVLPAFSAFTGGHVLDLDAGDAAVACNGRALVSIRRR